ncbi:fimbrial protein [Pseudomonas sp. Irchel s3a18]|uniref:fimbrial protein n=1 Tax=Pseudomonas sp. Irchel s3a18 TaxID=2009053 RepID=UPI00117BD2C6|nr:fimbrial protein [Pseudomonas sp. Irchel s3a18]
MQTWQLFSKPMRHESIGLLISGFNMISSKTLLGSLTFALVSPFIPLALAHAADTCYWKDGTPGPIAYTINAGTHYVPRDVPRSTPIGPVNRRYGPVSGGGLAIDCQTNGPRIDFIGRNHVPLVPGTFNPVNGEDITGKVLMTNVDGVGVVVKLSPQYDTAWTSVSGSLAVPYAGYIQRYMPFVLSHSLMWPYITFIKTGDIAPGIHQLNVPDLLGGEFTGVGNAFTMSLTGTVIQAECTLSTNPVSADPVDLGTWNLSEFTAVGHSTTPEPFNITLNACRADDRTPAQTITYAHIRLEPTAGSLIHDAASGQFTLGTGSTAKGVVMQILHDDETPIALASEVKLKAINPGTTTLSFKARLYQTAAPDLVEAGSAKGSLSFTITYL